MRVSVVLEQRFDKTSDGQIRAASGVCAYKFWQRYLEVFDSVNVIARVRENASDVSCSREFSDSRADGDRVSFSCVPHFIGPRQYVLKAWKIHQALRQSIGRRDAVILRVPGTLASCLQPYLQRTGHPYAVEVVGDPYDVFAPGTVKHPLRPVFRRLFSWRLRHQCDTARACSYVTEKKLQLRYPPGRGSFSTHFSSIELPPEAIAEATRQSTPGKNRFSIVHVGSLSQLYKAPDVLVDAVARCVLKGMDLQLTMIGDGRARPILESLPAASKLGNRLRFPGQLPAGKAIRDELDKADLFVLPSRTEGLPRAMIEAMARGLPCIGSTVGGFPELLPDEDLVPPDDTAALAQKIQEVLTNKDRMQRMSRRNLEKAKEYGSDILRARRTAFYQHIKEASKAA